MTVFEFVLAAASLTLAAMNVFKMNSGNLFYCWCGIPVHYILAVLAVFFILLGALSHRYQKQIPAASADAASSDAGSADADPGKQKRGLYLFEIAVYLVVALIIGGVVYYLMNEAQLYPRIGGILVNHFHQMLFAATAIPGLLSLLPVSPAAKGKKAPGLAILSFILVILILLPVGLMCVGLKLNPQGADVTLCTVVAAIFAVILFIQSIRRLKRS